MGDWFVLRIFSSGCFFEAKISESSVEMVKSMNWYILKNKHTNYVSGRTGSNPVVTLHRLLMGFPEGKIVDHINGNGLDNRLENLRLCTPSQNCMNARTKNKGVSFHNGKYRARIHVNKKSIFLGHFSTEWEAKAAYNIAAKEHHGEFAVLHQEENVKV